MAWVAGLAAWPSNLALNASSAQVAASHRAHAAPAVTQYLLVEGVAGLLLGVVLAAAWVSAAGRRPGWTARAAGVLGAGAVLVSLTQSVLGLILTAAATNHEIARAGDLFGVVDRLDGVKMLALAGVAAWLAVRFGAHQRPRQLPRWLQAAAVLAAVSLIVSGVSYLLLANALAWTVYFSGPLLLLWITATGIWLTVRVRTGPDHS